MLEIAPLKVAVVACLGRAGDIEHLAVPDTVTLRTAPDEVLLLCAPDRASGVVAAATSALGTGGLVADQTDAFSGWTLSGSDVHELFVRLCAIPLDSEHDSLMQGLFAKVPAKILVNQHHLHVLVSSVHAHHIPLRLKSAGAEFDVRQVDAVVFQPATATQAVA